jgi:hypothetical protein
MKPSRLVAMKTEHFARALATLEAELIDARDLG